MITSNSEPLPSKTSDDYLQKLREAHPMEKLQAAIDLLQANIHERDRLLFERQNLLRRILAHPYSRAGLRVRDKDGDVLAEAERLATYRATPETSAVDMFRALVTRFSLSREGALSLVRDHNFPGEPTPLKANVDRWECHKCKALNPPAMTDCFNCGHHQSI